MKRVLVTGASGFVGRHCVDLLAKRGFHVHAVRNSHAEIELPGVTWHAVDLLSSRQTRKLIRDVTPSHLLHLAWYAEPTAFWDSPQNLNWVRASLTLIEQFAQHGGQRAVLAGTCAEYDWSDGTCREDETPLVPQGVYGACKHAVQAVTSAYADTIGLNLAWGRLFFLYGPGEPREKLVASVIQSLRRGESATCRHGQLMRDYLHVSDAAGAFAELIAGETQGAVNIGSGHGVKLGDLVRSIGQILDCGELVNIIEESTKPERIIADVTRLRDVVGFSPKLDLNTGLEQTISWWKQQETAR